MRPSRGMGEQGERVFISGERGNKCQLLRGTKAILENREHKKKWGGGGEQAHLFQGNKGTGTPWEGLRCTMVSLPVRRGNPRVLASELSPVQVDNHGKTISYHLHQCRPGIYLALGAKGGRFCINVSLDCWSIRRCCFFS